jgi:hypothetical protein
MGAALNAALQEIFFCMPFWAHMIRVLALVYAMHFTVSEALEHYGLLPP